MRTRLLALGLLLACVSPSFAQNDAERVRAAKALTRDRKYAEARQAWTAVLASAQGADADAAAYWIARSSEKLGERERAFKEYGTFLARRPADRSLLDEARTSRIGLAAQLYRAGQTSYVNVMHEGLTDSNKTVRYFAALQLGGLGAPTSKRAVPVLQEILARETDDDLVDRARIILMKLDP
ncbi:MAG TPA: HEAT repeat domain-containing protein, partial [Vicinamibacteria bacterium]|nr:HEAT repeat domain-containing protein [Vicinamibacteria bacterium]